MPQPITTSKMSDKEWQAHDDANTLARAREIEADTRRRVAAVKMAKRLAKEDMERARAMTNVAKMKTKRRK